MPLVHFTLVGLKNHWLFVLILLEDIKLTLKYLNVILFMLLSILVNLRPFIKDIGLQILIKDLIKYQMVVGTSVNM
jgi:hypothetical protein